MKIAFFTNFERDVGGEKTRQLQNFVQRSGHEICEISDNADVIVVLGGDGTLLSAVRRGFHDAPMLGINLGRLGYLTDVDFENAENAFDKVLKNNYTIEHRMMLDVTILNSTNPPISTLNDLVIYRGKNPRPLNYRLRLNGEFMDDFLADGLIVATPTGSTAYNLSAGGPLLAPNSQMMAITPVSPHCLRSRPTVLPHDSVISIAFDASPEISIACDGEAVFEEDVCNNKNIEFQVKKSSKITKIIRTNGLNFYETFRRKITNAGIS